MFGDSFLAAPVLTPGARSRSVYLPTAVGSGGQAEHPVEQWKHHWTGKLYSGGASYVVPAPMSEFPLFERQSAPLNV